MARKTEEHAQNTDTPIRAVPTRLLMILLLAFTGALGLKAWEERVTADEAVLAQQSREALAIAGHARSELSALRGRLEGLLTAGADPGAVRSQLGALAVSQRRPKSNDWAELTADRERTRVFARDNSGSWWSADIRADRVMPEPLGQRRFHLDIARQSQSGAWFVRERWTRTATACAPIAGANVSVCVERDLELFSLADYNRIAIYMLLLAAPGLAVVGLVRAVKDAQDRSTPDSEAAARAQTVEEQTFEIGGRSGFWTIDPKKLQISLSAQAADLLGSIHHENISVDDFALLIADKDRAQIIAQMQKLPESGHISAAFQGAERRGAHYFEFYGGVTKNGVTGVVMDVTDKVRAQMRSQRAERLLRFAVDAYPGPFAAWDNHRRLIYWNKAFQREFSLHETSLRRGASYDTIMAEASRSVRVERPISSQGDAREMLLMSEKWISFVDRKTAGGGLISVGLDVTPMKRHEADLSAKEKSLRRLVTDLDRSQGQAEELAKRAQEATAKAERASRSKSVFLANMSHELRTPLNAINGFSEMLVKELYGPLGDDRYKGYAEDILQSGQHLLDMINDILDMAKIEAGKMSISPRQIDPIEAVDAAVRMIRRRALDKQIELTLHANGDLPEIEGDHRAIKQMVLNLVSNAIKFTDPGGKIDVTAETEDRFIAVRVKDSGIGIPAEDLPRLAQPFEQASADETRNSQGTGLGLALTKSFAEMHGGHLTIESVVGEGTTVAFFLPIEQGPRTQKTNDKVRAA